MGIFDGIITTGMHTLFGDAIDALLEINALSTPCKLIFDDTNTEVCPNCEFDSVSKASAGIYKTGGPIPFTNGSCPYCHSIGLVTLDTTVVIYPMVVWTYKDWIGAKPDNTFIPYSIAQTITKMVTLQDIKRAKQIWLSTDQDEYTKHTFERTCDPFTIGFGTTVYVICNWKRVGGS
jgi:hypothetical protein